MLQYQNPNEHEGLNLVVERAKSPGEYASYPQSLNNVCRTSSNSMPTPSTPAEATFAKIAPLLSQGMLHHQSHPPGMIVTHSQSIGGDRLLMTAPGIHHQKEEQSHEVLHRIPVGSHHQSSSVIAGSERSSLIETREHRELRGMSRSGSVEISRNDVMSKSTTVNEDGTVPVATYAPKYGFQTVVQVFAHYYQNCLSVFKFNAPQLTKLNYLICTDF